LQSAKTSGILIDYAFQARGMTLASTVYTGKFAGVKSTFLFTFTGLNETKGKFVQKRKMFLDVLKRSFQ